TAPRAVRLSQENSIPRLLGRWPPPGQRRQLRHHERLGSRDRPPPHHPVRIPRHAKGQAPRRLAGLPPRRLLRRLPRRRTLRGLARRRGPENTRLRRRATAPAGATGGRAEAGWAESWIAVRRAFGKNRGPAPFFLPSPFFQPSG